MTRHLARIQISTAIVAGLAFACAHGSSEDVSQAPKPSTAQAPESSTISSPAPSPTTFNSARESSSSLEEMLAGRIAGVRVQRVAGGGIAVQIRGPTSFYASNEPLYVVDGVAVNPGRNGALPWLRPEDIESITVLKDAAAAIYGIRGGNGVIVIKTKGSN